MVMVEFREAAYDKALELIDKSKKHTKKTKMALCELEDVIDELASEESESEEDVDDLETRDHDEDFDELNHRKMRLENRSGMRTYGERRMRMRRNRLGRYAY